jgi:ribose/xylose/arabinose/galactoside ABC-type transport system permease subunit
MKNRLKHSLNSTTRYNITLFLVLVAFIVLFTLMNPKFLAKYNIFLLFRQNLPVMIIACALTFVVTSGSIDLSVGGVMALSAITYAALCVKGINPWWAIGLVALLGAAIGIINTILIEKLDIPAFMATIAGWLIYGGLAFTVCGGPNPIAKPEMQVVTILDDKATYVGPFPLALVIVVVVIAIFLFLEKKTVLGKYAIAIGGNYNAAYFSGINVLKMRAIYSVLCSVMAALSGVWQVARLSTADPRCIGLGVEFAALSACIVGGANIKGGQGSVVGSVLGVLLLAVLPNGVQLMKSALPVWLQWLKSPFLPQVITGIVLLIVVFINYLLGRSKQYE